MSDDPVELSNVHLNDETDDAWNFKIDGGVDIWVPKSVGRYDVTKNFVVIPDWFAREKGVIW